MRLLKALLCTSPLPLLSLRCCLLVLTKCIISTLRLLLLIRLLELVLSIVKSREIKLLLLRFFLLLSRSLLLLAKETLAQLA